MTKEIRSKNARYGIVARMQTEEEKSNLNPPLPLNIPHIAAAVNTYGLFKGVEPEYINLSEKLVDLCKRVNRQTGVGYKRVILFTAMVT